MQTVDIHADIEARIVRLLDRLWRAADADSPDRPVFRAAGAELTAAFAALSAGPDPRAALPRLQRVRHLLGLVKDATPLAEAASAIVVTIAGPVTIASPVSGA
jgi:hypothetical protein